MLSDAVRVVTDRMRASISPDITTTPTSATFRIVEPDRLNLRQFLQLGSMVRSMGVRLSIGNSDRSVVITAHANGDASLQEAEERLLQLERSRSAVEVRDFHLRASASSPATSPPMHDANLDAVMLRLCKQFPTDAATSRKVQAVVNPRDSTVMNVRVTMEPGAVIPLSAFHTLTQLTQLMDVEFGTATLPQPRTHVLMMLVTIRRRVAKRHHAKSQRLSGDARGKVRVLARARLSTPFASTFGGFVRAARTVGALDARAQNTEGSDGDDGDDGDDDEFDCGDGDDDGDDGDAGDDARAEVESSRYTY